MLYIIILAIVQGATEFLPVSSSGHLELFKNILFLKHNLAPISQFSGNFINLALHMGTLMSVCLYYRKDLRNLIFGFFRFVRVLILRNKENQSENDRFQFNQIM